MSIDPIFQKQMEKLFDCVSKSVESRYSIRANAEAIEAKKREEARERGELELFDRKRNLSLRLSRAIREMDKATSQENLESLLKDLVVDLLVL